VGARSSTSRATSSAPPSGAGSSVTAARPADRDPRRRAGIDYGAFGLDETAKSDTRQVLALTSGLVFAGRYRLVARLARGGMGTVWSATDERLGREVAIKFMAPELADDDESRSRFEQEARAAARLVSRHVVGIHDHGLSDGIPYIVLERLEGEDLQRRLRREPRLSLALCGRIVAHATRALRAAQEAGIVHRDIKPQNLFLAVPTDGGEPEIKLLDFGVAKHAGTEALRTRTGILVGSPHYMSPEQIRGQRDLDVRSDLFSLAAVTYRCLTGQVPYDGDMAAVMFRITQGPPAPPTSVAPDLPPELDAFFATAMATDREDRFSTPIAMADAFQAIVARHPGAVPPAPRPKVSPTRTLPGAGPPSVRPGAALRTASDHPTIVGMPSDVMGPPSSGPAPRASDAPTQVMAASQVLGFTQAGGDPGPSPWERARQAAAPAPPMVDDDLAEMAGLRPSGRVAVLIVAGLLAVLVVLVAVLLVA
jgi:serine/threonine-protein kinase